MINKVLLLNILSVFLIFSELRAQDVTILFSVNMSYQIETGNFDPATEFVDLAGDFNGWGSDLTILSDDDEEKIESDNSSMCITMISALCLLAK